MPAKPTTTLQLLAQHANILVELRARGVLRSTNNPVADYTEALVARALGLKLASKSAAGYDATDEATGERYEIKGRRLTPGTPGGMNPQVSAIRDLDKHHFDFLVGVLFKADYTVLRAAKIPHATIKEACPFVPHTNAHRLRLSTPMWDRPGVEDVTEKLRQAQLAFG